MTSAPVVLELTAPRSAELFGRLGNMPERALPLRNLAYLDRLRGDLDAATRHHEEALVLLRRLLETRCLLGLAELAIADGQPGEAELSLSRAMELTRTIDLPLYHAQAAAPGPAGRRGHEP